jgi:hypothetical protein
MNEHTPQKLSTQRSYHGTLCLHRYHMSPRLHADVLLLLLSESSLSLLLHTVTAVVGSVIYLRVIVQLAL